MTTVPTRRIWRSSPDTFKIIGVDPNLDADDSHFLFPGPQNDTLFPNRRDLLFAEIQIPDIPETFFVLVTHAKSRLGGRAFTDPRREGAAAALVQVLEQRFDEKDFVLLGDFNDNPDDRSLNILETGNPSTTGGPEEEDGPFLMNLMDVLVAAGHVSHGRDAMDIVGDHINTIDPQSRERNNVNRGTDVNTGDILFDQLLIPMRLKEWYVAASARVFDRPVAIEGSGNTRALQTTCRCSRISSSVGETLSHRPEPASHHCYRIPWARTRGMSRSISPHHGRAEPGGLASEGQRSERVPTDGNGSGKRKPRRLR